MYCICSEFGEKRRHLFVMSVHSAKCVLGEKKRKADVTEGIKVQASNLTYSHLSGVRIKRDI